jgi:hypothetical protein
MPPVVEYQVFFMCFHFLSGLLVFLVWSCVVVLQAGTSVEQICGDGEASRRDKQSPMLGVRHSCMYRIEFSFEWDVLHHTLSAGLSGQGVKL